MKRYRSRMGMLLYLQKHYRPDISNTVCELSKCLTKATKLHYKEMIRVMQFVLQTKTKGLKLNIKNLHMTITDPQYTTPKQIIWFMHAFPDAAFAPDKDTRHSVSGFVIYLCGAPIHWRSRIQRSMKTLSTESEYITIADVVKEIMYIQNILRTLGISVGLPVIVYVDNLGAIYISKNTGSSTHTKHIDINYHYVKEFVDSGFCLACFVNTLL